MVEGIEPTARLSSARIDGYGHERTRQWAEVVRLRTELKRVGANRLPFVISFKFDLNADWSYQFDPTLLWNGEPVTRRPQLFRRKR
jgi:hypothetical protein